MSTFAERLSAARKDKGWSQSELARIMGLSPQAVQGWESGRSAPRNAKLFTLSQHLGVTVESLMGEDDPVRDEDSAKGQALIRIVQPQVLMLDSARQSRFDGHQAFAVTDLKRFGIKARNVMCIRLSGNSMQPAIPPMSLLAIDKEDIQVVDGSVYAIAHHGDVRIKVLYRGPGGALRLRSYNTAEHPDETYSATEADAQGISVLGRIFWISQYLP